MLWISFPGGRRVPSGRYTKTGRTLMNLKAIVGVQSCLSLFIGKDKFPVGDFPNFHSSFAGTTPVITKND